MTRRSYISYKYVKTVASHLVNIFVILDVYKIWQHLRTKRLLKKYLIHETCYAREHSLK